jgi:hypothetical protein
MSALSVSPNARGLAAAPIEQGRLTTAAIVTGASALLVAAAVHLAQLISIFHAVPNLGPLFAADTVASTTIAIVLLVFRRRLAAAAGALLSCGALAGLVLASTTGLLGWHEQTLRPAVVIAIGAELIAVATLGPLGLPAPARRGRRLWRATSAGALVGIAVLHLAAAPDEWGDTRMVFWLFVVLAAACLALAVRLGQGVDRPAWALVLALAVVPLAGYILSRTTGLPGATDDVGDWANPFGIAALVIEVALVPLAVSAAEPLRRPRDGRRYAASPLGASET